jgi:hypothetical protein
MTATLVFLACAVVTWIAYRIVEYKGWPKKWTCWANVLRAITIYYLILTVLSLGVYLAVKFA